MGRNNKTLAFQFHERMESMVRIGESKHFAKAEYKQHQEKRNEKWNPSKATGIFSYNTYKAYQQTSIEFRRWIRDEYPEIKKIEQIETKHVGEYLILRESEGKSPYTVSKDMSAMNKILNMSITKKDFDLGNRSYKNITRSRLERSHDKHVKLERYKDQIDFAKGTGCRRESILKVNPTHLIRDNDGIVIKVFFKEKGGRPRKANVLEKYRQRITEIADGKDNDKPIFDKYPIRIDNHSFRREYALERYKEETTKKGDRVDTKKKYDKECILIVSKDLGHNRESVVKENYLPHH